MRVTTRSRVTIKHTQILISMPKYDYFSFFFLCQREHRAMCAGAGGGRGNRWLGRKSTVPLKNTSIIYDNTYTQRCFMNIGIIIIMVNTTTNNDDDVVFLDV